MTNDRQRNLRCLFVLVCGFDHAHFKSRWLLYKSDRHTNTRACGQKRLFSLSFFFLYKLWILCCPDWSRRLNIKTKRCNNQRVFGGAGHFNLSTPGNDCVKDLISPRGNQFCEILDLSTPGIDLVKFSISPHQESNFY